MNCNLYCLKKKTNKKEQCLSASKLQVFQTCHDWWRWRIFMPVTTWNTLLYEVEEILLLSQLMYAAFMMHQGMIFKIWWIIKKTFENKTSLKDAFGWNL